MPDAVTIRRLRPDEAAQGIDALSQVLMDCVDGGASVSFMAPLEPGTARAFWEKVAAGVATGDRVVLVAEDAAGAIVGTAQLALDLPENQPHRADVAKVLVVRAARRRGIAAALMAAVEVEARRERRTLLVLDTVTGGDAERLYERLGWVRVGVVPGYALMPDGAPCGTTIFYKTV